MAELDRKMAELASMKASLEQIMSSFPGDDRADCPILSKLDCAAPATLSHEHRQRTNASAARREAPSYVRLAAWSRALNGGFAAQHA